MNKLLTNYQARDLQSLIHPYTNAITLKDTGAHFIEKGEGIYVYDDKNKKYIEGMSGLWCCGLGFSNSELIEAAKRQIEKLPYYHLFGGRSHEPAVELAEKIKELTPGKMGRVFYQSSGSEANETQIKLAWYYNNAKGQRDRKKVISRKKGYHGVSIVSASLTGLPYNHLDFDLPLHFVRHTDTPHFWREKLDGETEEDFSKRLARSLEELILLEGPETIAAFIAEPVMGAGGVIVPPKYYFEEISKVLEKYNILKISDEVICGFGRTGEWFGSKTLNFEPDSISIAKQLTAGYAPLSAVAINEDMAEVIERNTEKIGTFGHGFTYGGHPVGCAVAVKALELYEKLNIVEKVKKLSPIFKKKLKSFSDHELVGEARSLGLMGALELTPNKTPHPFSPIGKVGAKMASELLDRGVMVRAIGDSVAFCPPMIITEEQLNELFNPVRDALNATRDWAFSEGFIN